MFNKENYVNKSNVKQSYVVAFSGARTAKGGEILTGTSELSIDGHVGLRVGDIATYPDGRSAEIISGAGNAVCFDGVPMAIVGSVLSNGDTIVSSSTSLFTFNEIEGAPIPGLLEPGYRFFAVNGVQN
ncbi:PAAR domain-containing protein [Cupriavidus basilensis]|uniref:PAAR domain-containing protein n=1 Tax=Cupriavidus basilensis TaxID=68895 RepID=UPI0009E33C2A|nr:PAAR domain-containing protein [Cupriavidus basilensis]